MAELRALGFWDDNTYYPCLLKDVEEPRKSVDQYKIGEKIRTRIRGFRNYYTGEIIAISSDLKQLKTLQKELESKKIPSPQPGPKRKSTSVNNDQPEKNGEKKKQKQADDNVQQARVNDNTQTQPGSQKQKRGKKTGSDQENKNQKQVDDNVQQSRENDNTQTRGKNSTKKIDHDHVTQAERKRLAKEETAKKKSVEAARNASFLQSLDVFKEKVHVQLSASNIDSPDTSLQEEVPRTPVSTPGQLTIGSPKIQQPVSNTDNSSLQEEVPRTPVSTPGQLAIGSSKIQQPASNTDSPNSSLQEEVPRTPVRTLSQLGIGSPNTMGSPGGWIPQNTSTPITSPTCTWQNGAMGDSNRVQQNWTPVRPRTDLSWQTMPSFTALISSAEVPGAANDMRSHPLGTALQKARMTLDEPHEASTYLDLSEQVTGFSDISERTSEEQTNPCQRCESYESLQERVRELENKLRRTRQENLRLQQHNSSQSGPLNPTDSQARLQRDGKPRAGLVTTDQAEQYKMVELMPGSSVYIYPATLRAVQKVKSQTGKARTLLSTFYSNAELVQAGNLTGANGKQGLNENIISAIVEYSLLQGMTTSCAEIKSSLRRKITGLTSWTSNKENSF